MGLVTSVTYLVCAYVLPAWFMLKLMGDKINVIEKIVLWSLIPASLLVSGVGLWASIISLINDMGSAEGWGISHAAQPLFALARAAGVA